ncbi:MAG: hypothetical protein ACOH5I_14310 [Oligoflexus sp.]
MGRMLPFGIRILFILQCLGLAGLAWLDGSKLSLFLFLETSLAEEIAIFVNYGMVALLFALSLAACFKLRAGYLMIAGAVFLLEALLTSYLGGGFGAKYALFAQVSRFAWLILFALAYWLHHQRAQEGFPLWLNRGLRLALAVTFFTHGVEALYQHPKFIDLLIVASKNLTPLEITESMATGLLQLIGWIDISCAVFLLVGVRMALLYYMAFWGLITALARVVDGGFLFVPDALVRSAHWGIPLLLAYGIQFKKQASLSKRVKNKTAAFAASS